METRILAKRGRFLGNAPGMLLLALAAIITPHPPRQQRGAGGNSRHRAKA